MFDVHAILDEARQQFIRYNDILSNRQFGRTRTYGEELWSIANRHARRGNDTTMMDFLNSTIHTRCDAYNDDAHIDRFLMALKTGELQE